MGAAKQEGVFVEDPTYNLTKMNRNSVSNVTHVSIKLDPKPINVASKSAVAKGAVPIYDSRKIPDVDLRYFESFKKINVYLPPLSPLSL